MLLCSPSCPSHDLPAVTLPRPAWRLTVRSSVGVSQTLLAKRPVSPPFEATWVKLLDLQVESRTCRSRLSPYLPRSYQGSLKQSGVRYATQAPQLPPDARERHKPPSKGAVLEPKWLRHSPPSRTLESLAEATVCGLGLGVELLDESEEAAHTSSQLKEAPKTVGSAKRRFADTCIAPSLAPSNMRLQLVQVLLPGLQRRAPGQ